MQRCKQEVFSLLINLTVVVLIIKSLIWPMKCQKRVKKKASLAYKTSSSNIFFVQATVQNPKIFCFLYCKTKKNIIFFTYENLETSSFC